MRRTLQQAVAASILPKKCQGCGADKAHMREIYGKNYVGGCGDSFCWASCNSSSCKAVRAIVCDACFKRFSK